MNKLPARMYFEVNEMGNKEFSWSANITVISWWSLWISHPKRNALIKKTSRKVHKLVQGSSLRCLKTIASYTRTIIVLISLNIPYL